MNSIRELSVVREDGGMVRYGICNALPLHRLCPSRNDDWTEFRSDRQADTRCKLVARGTRRWSVSVLYQNTPAAVCTETRLCRSGANAQKARKDVNKVKQRVGRKVGGWNRSSDCVGPDATLCWLFVHLVSWSSRRLASVAKPG